MLGFVAVVGGWILVGALLLLFAPQDRALDPDQAAFSYGAKRTTFSSSSAGILAFFRLLQRAGFECERLGDFSLPETGVLFILEPEIWLNETEVAELLAWVRAGGSLVYAPPRFHATTKEEGEVIEIELEDPLLAQIHLAPATALGAGVELARLGSGRITVIESGGARLANQTLFDSGIASELGWINAALAGHEKVFFDEARAGAMLRGGLFTLLMSGRYREPVVLSLLVIALAFWSAYRRDRPVLARSDQAREDGEREHLHALARSMQDDGRSELARSALLRGATRRASTRAQALEEIERLRSAATDVTGLAAGLRRLEREVRMG